jgi:hypothetical protein
MEISEIIPKGSQRRDLYCDACGASMDLVFADFSHEVSGVHIGITALPQLRCHACDALYLTEGAAFAIVELHRQAVEKGSPSVDVKRRKLEADFKFSDVPFLIDADDYHYIPGLVRPLDVGFLTPLFFNKEVLIKFDNSPEYTVQFASPTYGTIDMKEDYIPFGVNRHGKVVMWLGDVAKLPESEQFYLRSENVPSDHSLGSEFYDAQIECKFTDPPKETLAIKARSAFALAFENKFGARAFHLDAELIDTIAGLAPPLVDTEKERKHIFDSLNRVFVESIDNAGLDKLLKRLGIEAAGSGSLKRLQAVLETVDAAGAVAAALMPFYVLYDLRVAYSHLTSRKRREKLLSSSAARLGIASGAKLEESYGVLIDKIVAALDALTAMI